MSGANTLYLKYKRASEASYSLKTRAKRSVASYPQPNHFADVLQMV